MDARSLLQALLQEQRLTFGGFRRAYEKTARELAKETGSPGIATATVEEQTFRRWTSGRVRRPPMEPAPQILQRMFGYSTEVLLSPPPKPPTPTIQARELDERELVMAARDAASHASDAASLSVPDMTLDQLDDDVLALARDYNQTSPIEVFYRAKDLLDAAQALLERTQVPRQRTRGYLAAGQAAALLSAICFDLGYLPAAVSLSRTAALYGQVIEHGPLQAYAHGALALLAFWGGRPSEAVRLVHTAQQFGGLGDTARTRLFVIEGRAYGHLRNRSAAQSAIRNALDQDSGQRDELHDDIAGEFAFPHDRVAMSNATTYLLLRDAEGAEAAADSALRLANAQEQRPLLITTQASADLARARLLRRELDGAQDALEPVFDVPSEWRGAGLLERLGAVRDGLRHPDFSSAVADTLGERIEEFSAAATANRLSATSLLAIDE